MEEKETLKSVDASQPSLAVNGFEEHSAMIVKWFTLLLGCQVIGVIPEIYKAYAYSIGYQYILPLARAERISDVATLVSLIAIFKLGKIHKGYHKMLIFCGIAVTVAAALALLGASERVTAVGCAVPVLIACYKEFQTHSEITAYKNIRLSKAWRSLLYIYLCFIIITYFVSERILSTATFWTYGDAENKIVIFSAILATIPKLLHTLYLARTIEMYWKE